MIIAEVAQAHDGSLGTAHAYIDVVAKAGADAIKFQTHIAEAESSPQEPWRVKFSKQDASRYDYWKRMEFTAEQWAGLKEHADEKGLKFLSSAFSLEAVELLEKIGVYAWKIASGEINNKPMFESILATRRPVWLSTGMSSLEEVDTAVELIQSHKADLTIFQCTSMYPTPNEKVGLNMIPTFKERYGCPIGLSDHSGDIYAGLAATTLGASDIEIHIAFSKEVFGPDVPVSLTPEQLQRLCEGVRSIKTMLQNPVDKDAMAADLSNMRQLFNKSIFIKKDLPVGTTLTFEHLAFKKPGTGINAGNYENIIGKSLRQAYQAGEMLQLDHLD